MKQQQHNTLESTKEFIRSTYKRKGRGYTEECPLTKEELIEGIRNLEPEVDKALEQNVNTPFAQLEWLPDDILSLAPHWNEEKCLEAMKQNEQRLKGSLITHGFHVLRDIIKEQEDAVQISQ